MTRLSVLNAFFIGNGRWENTYLEEVVMMEKICYLCGKQLAEKDEYQFFPEDDSYICKGCLIKTPKKEERNEKKSRCS